MFDLVINRDNRILKELKAMALDLTKLSAAVARNTAAVDALVASHADPAAQVAVDAAADAVDANSAKAEAAVAPAPPAG